MYSIKKYFFLLFAAILMMAACSQSNTCLTPKTVALRAGFYYHPTDSTSKDSSVLNANIFFGNQSLMYKSNLKNTNGFSIPLSQVDDSLTIYFQSDSLISLPSTIDTIQLAYSRKLHFISTACGYETYYTLQRITTTHQVIDSIAISQAEVSNDVNKQHIRIVLKN
jgi:hypothetical protein